MKEITMKGEYFIGASIFLVLASAILGAVAYGTTTPTFNHAEAMEQNAVITVYGYDVESNVKEFAVYATNPEQVKVYDFEDILDIEGTYEYSFVNQKRAIIDVRIEK